MRRILLGFLFFSVLLIVFAGTVMAQGLGDPFEGNALKNANWIWQNEPNNWDVGVTKAGWLTLIPSINQNLWASDTTARLYQEFDGDFEVETHLVVDYASDCIVAGIVAYGPVENNWTTLKVWGRAGDAIIQWQHKESEVVGNVPGSSQPAGIVEYYFRMEKDGGNYMGWWKAAEGDDWIRIEPDAPFELTPPIQVGIYGGICTGAGTATVQYEYFEDLNAPSDGTTSVDPMEKLSATWGSLKSEY